MATAPPVSPPDADGYVLPNPDNGTTGGTYPMKYPAPGTTIDRRQLAQQAATTGKALADAADAASGSLPPGNVTVRALGDRIAQIIETRPDGTTTTGTPEYVADRLTKVVFTNPARTLTYTYLPSGLVTTGWSVS